MLKETFPPLALVIEDELVFSRSWSRDITTSRPPSPSSNSIDGEGRGTRSDSFFLYGRKCLLLHASLFIEDAILPLDGRT